MGERSIDIGINVEDNASATLEQIGSQAQQTGDDIKTGFNDGSDAVKQETDAIDESANATDLLGGAIQGVIALGLADTLLQCAEAAGNYNDSVERVNLAMEGVGVSGEETKRIVSELSETTGRSASSIRESMIQMSSYGITSSSVMEQVFRTASGQAYILGTSVDSVANKYASLAMKSSIAERTLKGSGITVAELGQALGMQGATIDEVNQKWEKLTIDQRASILAQAGAMNEGAKATDEYKSSWAGVHEQLDKATGMLMRMVGEVLLPTLIPAIQIATQILTKLGQVISWVMSSPLSGLVSVLGTLATSLLLLKLSIGAINTVLALFGAELSFATISEIAYTVALNAMRIADELATVAQWALNAALNANPIGLVVIAVMALVAALTYLYYNNETVRNAVNALANVLKGTVVAAFNKVMQIVNKVTGVFKTLYNTFTTAKNKASSMVSGIVSTISSLPGKIAAEFGKIPQRIKQAIRDAMNAAFGYGSILFNAVMDALGIHSPGFIQKNITKEFMDTNKQIMGQVKGAEKAGNAYSSAILNGFETPKLSSSLSANVTGDKGSWEFVHVYDLRNVPSHINENQLVKMIKESNGTFVNALANDMKFQNADLKMKNRLSSKSIRARGA